MRNPDYKTNLSTELSVPINFHVFRVGRQEGNFNPTLPETFKVHASTYTCKVKLQFFKNYLEEDPPPRILKENAKHFFDNIWANNRQDSKELGS